MGTLWDGEDMADAIGRRLEERGFVPFGIGLPYAARDAVIEYMAELASNMEVVEACEDAGWYVCADDVRAVLAMFIQYCQVETVIDEDEGECPGLCGEHHWLDRPESDTRECLVCGVDG